ncbi:unnamed protein product [Closterium sp. NIES-54]
MLRVRLIALIRNPVSVFIGLCLRARVMYYRYHRYYLASLPISSLSNASQSRPVFSFVPTAVYLPPAPQLYLPSHLPPCLRAPRLPTIASMKQQFQPHMPLLAPPDARTPPRSDSSDECTPRRPLPPRKATAWSFTDLRKLLLGGTSAGGGQGGQGSTFRTVAPLTAAITALSSPIAALAAPVTEPLANRAPGDGVATSEGAVAQSAARSAEAAATEGLGDGNDGMGRVISAPAAVAGVTVLLRRLGSVCMIILLLLPLLLQLGPSTSDGSSTALDIPVDSKVTKNPLPCLPHRGNGTPFLHSPTPPHPSPPPPTPPVPTNLPCLSKPRATALTRLAGSRDVAHDWTTRTAGRQASHGDDNVLEREDPEIVAAAPSPASVRAADFEGLAEKEAEEHRAVEEEARQGAAEVLAEAAVAEEAEAGEGEAVEGEAGEGEAWEAENEAWPTEPFPEEAVSSGGGRSGNAEALAAAGGESAQTERAKDAEIQARKGARSSVGASGWAAQDFLRGSSAAAAATPRGRAEEEYADGGNGGGVGGAGGDVRWDGGDVERSAGGRAGKYGSGRYGGSSSSGDSSSSSSSSGGGGGGGGGGGFQNALPRKARLVLQRMQAAGLPVPRDPWMCADRVADVEGYTRPTERLRGSLLYRGSTIGTDDCQLFLTAATTPSPFNHTFSTLPPLSPLSALSPLSPPATLSTPSPFDPLPFLLSSNSSSSSSSFPLSSVSPSPSTPKLAFLFLSRGPLPLARLWARFFRGYERHYSAYLHPAPGYRVPRGLRRALNLTVVPSKPAFWGTLSIVEAIKRLLANALLDPHNVRFIVLSERDIPLHPFPAIHRYLLSSSLSFSGGHPKHFRDTLVAKHVFPPGLVRSGWVHGECWLEMARPHAWAVVSEWRWHEMGLQYCKSIYQPTCCVDENLIQTLLTLAFPHQVANRTVMSVFWKQATAHPHTYLRQDITAETIGGIKEEREYRWGGGKRVGGAGGRGREDEASSGSGSDTSGNSSANSSRRSRDSSSNSSSNGSSNSSGGTSNSSHSSARPTSAACMLNGQPAPCWLFARKFVGHSLPALLTLPDEVLGY